LFQLATSGNAVTTEIGELYVTYSFTMIRPKQPEPSAYGSVIHLTNAANDQTQAAPLGLTSYTSSVVKTGSTLSIVPMDTVAGVTAYTLGASVGLNDSVDTTINLPNVDGTWYIAFCWYAATAIAAAPSCTAAGGATLLSPWANSTGTTTNRFFIAAGTSASMSQTVTTVRDPTPIATTNSIVVGGLTGMTDGNVDIFVIRIPNLLLTMKSVPQFDTYRAELQLLQEQFRNYMNRDAHCDSDFDEEKVIDIEECHLSRKKAIPSLTKDGSSSSSSSTVAPLSNSMLEVIGEYVTRRSSSNKSSQ